MIVEAIRAYVVSSEKIAAGTDDVEDNWIKATVDVREVFKSGRRSSQPSSSPTSLARFRRGAQLVVWIPTNAITSGSPTTRRQRRRQLRQRRQRRVGVKCKPCPDIRPRRTYFLAGRYDANENEDVDAIAAVGLPTATSLIVDRSSSVVARWTAEMSRAVREAASNERRLRLTGKLYQTSGCR